MATSLSRKERKWGQAREEIIAATRRVLIEQGISGLTLAAVARDLQLTKPALYHYFNSKEALIFELVFLGAEKHARVVSRALKKANSGAEALEILMRRSSAHYTKHRDDLRLVYLLPQVGLGSTLKFSSEMLDRIRPFNDQVYAPVAERIAADQSTGHAPAGVEGRRLAFLAHSAVVGLMTIEGLVEAADTAPLLHSHEALVDDLVASFVGRLKPS